MPQLTPTDRTQVRRLRDRGHYDLDTIRAILDEGMVCHVGFAVDGQPCVIPTAYVRIGDALYVHGANANHALKAVAEGAPACVTITLTDGLVLARSTFHHSINYRSVVLFAQGDRIDDPDQKAAVLDALVEHLVPGRTADARAATPDELRKTLVIRLPIDEASAKIRTGGPVDDEDDMDLAVWAGVIPLTVQAAEPIDAPDLAAGIAPPAYATSYTRPR
jgi:nitroimidazol reductase NimA-like FMN-containing flavoprotein (pyridoxamine 5'-phosphate oxidase superfamily)